MKKKSFFIMALALVICTITAFSALVGCTTPEGDGDDGEKTVALKMAMLSDIHLQLEDDTATENFRRAVNFCVEKAGGIDAVVISGDIIDTTWWSNMVFEDVTIRNNNTTKYAEIAHMKAVMEEVIPDGVDLIYTTGNHDASTFSTTPGTPAKNSNTEYYAALKESEKNFFKSEVDPNTLYNIGFDMQKMHRYGMGYYRLNGSHFITLDCVKYWASKDAYSEVQLEWLDNALASLSATNPDENVFIITHVPAQDTLLGSTGTGGHNDLKPILIKYPQTVIISGHHHTSCYSEQSINQELGFTAIEACSVKYTSNSNYNMDTGFGVTYSPESYSSSQGLLITVYSDSSIVVERLDFTSGREAGKAWEIPAVNDKNRLNALKMSERAKTNTKPYFTDKTIKGEYASKQDVLNVKFNAASDNEYLVWAYRVAALYENGYAKEYIVDSGFASPDKPTSYCVSFENGSSVKSVTVVAEDGLFMKSDVLTLDRAAFTNEQRIIAPEETFEESATLGSITAGGVTYSASEMFFYDGPNFNNYKTMTARGSMYFTDAFTTDYSFGFVIKNMRLNRAYTINGYAYANYQIGANLASYEYNGRVYSLVAAFDFGYYSDAEDAPLNRRIETNNLKYLLVVSGSGIKTYTYQCDMSRFGMGGVELPSNLKERLCSDSGAKIIVERRGAVFTIKVDEEVIDVADLDFGYFVNGRYAEFSAETPSAFGVFASGAEANFIAPMWWKTPVEQ